MMPKVLPQGSWFNKPIFQFLMLGLLAYALQQWAGPQAFIAVTSNKISLLKDQWQTSTGLQANPARLKALVDVYVEEEMLFREALNKNLHEHPQVKQRIIKMAGFLELGSSDDNDEALYVKAIDAGLHKNDALVRSMMISSVRNSISTKSESITLTKEEINQYYLGNVDRYRAPGRVSFEHVFVSKNRNADGRRRAEELRLLEGFSSTASNSLASLGDPFIKGYRFSGLSMRKLTELMGTEFSQGVGQLNLGEWSKPIESVFGWHLVWVKKINPARVLSLVEAEHRVKRDLLKELKSQAFDTALSDIKRGYTVAIEWPDSGFDSDSGNESPQPGLIEGPQPGLIESPQPELLESPQLGLIKRPQLGLIKSPQLALTEGNGSQHD